jgi:ubiquinone/menaquinone biosynthesis C-methylase UbiE
MQLAGPLAGKTILDLGCGNGGLLLTLLSQPIKAAYGVDKSEAFLNRAREVVRDARVTFYKQDVITGRLPYEDGSVDVAFSVFVFNQLASLAHAVAELGRVLREGGNCLVVMTHPFFVLNYYLYEKYTGNKNTKFSVVRGYFEKFQADYVLTIAKETVPFFHHTLQDVVDALSNGGLVVRKIHELTVTAELMERVPEYAGGDDVPRYLIVEGWKAPQPVCTP